MCPQYIHNRCIQATICCDPMPMNATKGTNENNQALLRQSLYLRESQGEILFYQNCFNSNIHLSFNALKVVKCAKMYKCCSKNRHFF